LLEWFVSPASAIRSSFLNYLPGGVTHWIRSMRKKIQLRKATAQSKATRKELRAS